MDCVEEATAELDFKRASIISQEHVGKLPTKQLSDAPKDKLYLVRIIFFFYGLSSMLPMSFFMIANDYWMYKFRNTTYDNWDPHHRTPLQIYYGSILSIVKAVPVMLVSLLAAKYIHKLHLRPRLIYSTFITCSVFIALTVFVVIDTDDWQFLFLIVTAVLMTILSVADVVFRMSQTRLLARFPIIYMKFDMYGSGCSSLLSIFLQIISLAIGKDPISRALIFFICGSAVILTSLLLALASDYLPFYRYYVGNSSEDIKRPAKSFKELLKVAYCIWPNIAHFFIVVISMICAGSVSYLVVSEYYGNGNPWNEKYFVPVVTFLMPDIAGLVGKFFAKPIMTRKNAKWFILMTFVQRLIFTPLYFFCNAPTATERHIPILLPHDWQYITIVITDATSMSILGGICMLSMSRLTEGEKQKTEDGFIVISTLMGVFIGILSPLGTLCVKSL